MPTPSELARRRHEEEWRQVLEAGVLMDDEDLVEYAIVALVFIEGERAAEGDEPGRGPALIAAADGRVNVLQYLAGLDGALALGADHEGNTPMILAAENGHLAAVRFLASHDDVNRANNVGWTPALLAAGEGHIEVLRFLLDNGADANQPNHEGTTLAHAGADTNNTDVLRVLMDKEASMHLADADGKTPLIIAVENGLMDSIRFLVDEAGANVYEAGPDGMMPVHVAAEAGITTRKSIAVLGFLFDKDTDMINLRDGDWGWTPAHFAARDDQTDVLRWLHSKKARLDEPADDGHTPLHDAAKSGAVGAVEFLLRHGADVFRENNDHERAIVGAERAGAWRDARHCVRLLQGVANAGDWKTYIALLRMPYCKIRHTVSSLGAVLPEGEDAGKQRALYHFMFGGKDEVRPRARPRSRAERAAKRAKGGGPPIMLRAAPDALFAAVMSFLHF